MKYLKLAAAVALALAISYFTTITPSSPQQSALPAFVYTLPLDPSIQQRLHTAPNDAARLDILAGEACILDHQLQLEMAAHPHERTWPNNPLNAKYNGLLDAYNRFQGNQVEYDDSGRYKGFSTPHSVPTASPSLAGQEKKLCPHYAFN